MNSGRKHARRSSQRYRSRRYRPRRCLLQRIFVPAVCLILIVLVVLGIVRIVSCSSSSSADSSAEATAKALEETTLEKSAFSFELDAEAIADIPQTDTLSSFNISTLDEPDISDADFKAIGAVIDEIEQLGDVGLIFLDIDSGLGISYNIDTNVYGASSIKGAYACYVCQLVEEGQLSLDSYCAPVTGGGGSVEYELETMVVDSNNDSFGNLRTLCDDMGWNTWSAATGATNVEVDASSWYAWYSARSSAALWTKIKSYLDSESEIALWLKSLYGSTTTSFIRNGLTGSDATVYNKAGWCSDYDPTWNGTCDAGIIEAGGHTYLMSIMTGMADCDDSEVLVSSLAAAAFGVREDLNYDA